MQLPRKEVFTRNDRERLSANLFLKGEGERKKNGLVAECTDIPVGNVTRQPAER